MLLFLVLFLVLSFGLGRVVVGTSLVIFLFVGVVYRNVICLSLSLLLSVNKWNQQQRESIICHFCHGTVNGVRVTRAMVCDGLITYDR